MECATCGLAEGDLPDGVDPALVFETEDGVTQCIPCATGERLTVVF